MTRLRSRLLLPVSRQEDDMRLRQKNLWYSMALAGAMLLFLVGYFLYMLPSLYVDHVMDQNLKSIRAQHRAYMESGSYDGVRVQNSTACFSLEVPLKEEYVLLTGKGFSAEIRFRDGRLREILDSCKGKLAAMDGGGEALKDIDLEEELRELGEILEAAAGREMSLPISLKLRYLKDLEGEFFDESAKTHLYSDGSVILEMSVADSSNRYTNYIAIEKKEERLVMSVLPVVTPDADEIRPVVLQSLPMLGAVILLMVLLFSGVYSRGIVRPITALARHAEELKRTGDFSASLLSEKWADRKDEVRDLADTLDQLYGQVRESYRRLEEKNRELEEENQRQEIFLRSSSHQLKTPIAAALLLVDGMMNEIGRYRETKVYLPRVKEQLLSMRRMVEDILYLNHCAEDMRLQPTDMGALLRERLRACQVALTDRQLKVEIQGDDAFFADTDERMAVQILDNLLSNAVRYTPVGGSIRITMGEQEGRPWILIENSGAKIPEDILPHILEPFVSGSHEEVAGTKSHGLGLYIASYYAKKLGILLTVRNGEEGVAAGLTFS